MYFIIGKDEEGGNIEEYEENVEGVGDYMSSKTPRPRQHTTLRVITPGIGAIGGVGGDAGGGGIKCKPPCRRCGRKKCCCPHMTSGQIAIGGDGGVGGRG